MSTIGICRHCERENVKLCDAHIYPRSWYGSNPTEYNKILSKLDNRYPQTVRKGLYDQNITCQECDGLYGDDETYAGQTLDLFIFKTIGSPHPIADNLRMVSIDGLRFRRAILFILWKMTWADHPMFSRVRHAPYTSRLKNALMNPQICGFEIVVSYYYDLILNGVLFAEPKAEPMKGGAQYFEYRNFVMLPVGRCMIMINVDQRPLHAPFCDLQLKSDCLPLVPTTSKGNGILLSAKEIVDRNPKAFKK